MRVVKFCEKRQVGGFTGGIGGHGPSPSDGLSVGPYRHRLLPVCCPMPAWAHGALRRRTSAGSAALGGAAGPSGVLRAIDSTARPRSWRAFGLRRHQMPTTSSPGVGTAASAASRPRHAAAVCDGGRSRRMPRFRLLGFEAGQEGADAELELVVGGTAGQQRGKSGRPEAGLAGWRPGEVAQGVRRSDDAAGPGAQRTRGGRRRRLTSRQTAAHSRWGSGRRRAKTMVATPRSP